MTVMTTTFIPCGAKLPVIALVMGALIGDAELHVDRPALLFSGRHRRHRLGHHAQEDAPLCRSPHALRHGAAELPHAECAQLGFACVERVSAYVKKAFTIIFASTIVVWFLSNFGLFDGAFGYLPAMAGIPEEFTDHDCSPWLRVR